jgi:hypothetical protein
MTGMGAIAVLGQGIDAIDPAEARGPAELWAGAPSSAE